MKVSLLPIVTLLSVLDDKYVSGQSNTTAPGGEASEMPDGQPTPTPEASEVPVGSPPTPAPVAAQCFTNLDDVFAIESTASDVTVVRTYVLCPNTVFTLGRPNSDGSAVVGGTVPIVARPNAHYKCGDDGLSSNDCTLQGGDAAIQAAGGGNLVGVVIQGMTFRQQFFTGAFFNRPGEFDFIDCIFREQRNLGAVISFWPLQRRNLEGQEENVYTKMLNNAFQNFGIDRIEEETDKEKHRNLQVQNLTLNFHNVYFEENALALDPASFGPSYRPGIVTADTAQTIMNFDGCLFQYNNYGDTTNVMVSWGISAVGPLNITDTCFENSDFISSPVVIFGQDTVLSNNFGSGNNVMGGCEFVADYGAAALTSGLPLNELGNITCIDFDADACAYDFRTPAPIDPGAPTAAPVPTLPPVEPTRAPRRTSAPTMIPEDTPAPTPSPGESSSFSADYSFLGMLMSAMVGAALV